MGRDAIYLLCWNSVWSSVPGTEDSALSSRNRSVGAIRGSIAFGRIGAGNYSAQHSGVTDVISFINSVFSISVAMISGVT